MVTAFAVLLVVHGLIHLLGVAKAYGFAQLPQLTQPISPAMGVLWLVSALLFLGAAVTLFACPRWWWLIGGCAVLASTIAIASSWTDASAGAVVNVIVGAGVVFGFLSQGPYSLRAGYDADVERRVVRAASPPVITDDDLAHLPAPVQRYLRRAGVVGQPRVRDFMVRLHGRIREGRGTRWMPIVAEQHNTVAPAARLFYFDATMLSIPAQGYHRYVDGAASMRVKAAAVVPVVTSSGQAMTQAETVTLFNDMCVMAPATLIDPTIVWAEVDSRTARARYANAGRVVEAVLSFNDAGELANFVSDDRVQVSPDGTATPRRWSTPLGPYRAYGTAWLAGRGEGRWHDGEGDYPYIELTIDDVRYNVRTR